MTNGTWILLMLAAVLTVGYLCYLLGRRNSTQQQEIDRLEAELAQAREKADQVKAGVSSHFEQSAVLFGTLAKDYRAFLDHFSQSARSLGLSEGRTEELMEQVVRPLLGRSRDPDPPARVAAPASGSPGPESPRAGGAAASEDADAATAEAASAGEVARQPGAGREPPRETAREASAKAAPPERPPGNGDGQDRQAGATTEPAATAAPPRRNGANGDQAKRPEARGG